MQMPLDGPQLAEQGKVFNKNFFTDFKVSDKEWHYCCLRSIGDGVGHDRGQGPPCPPSCRLSQILAAIVFARGVLFSCACHERDEIVSARFTFVSAGWQLARLAQAWCSAISFIVIRRRTGD